MQLLLSQGTPPLNLLSITFYVTSDLSSLTAEPVKAETAYPKNDRY